jgi:hypothetical protein
VPSSHSTAALMFPTKPYEPGIVTGGLLFSSLDIRTRKVPHRGPRTRRSHGISPRKGLGQPRQRMVPNRPKSKASRRVSFDPMAPTSPTLLDCGSSCPLEGLTQAGPVPGDEARGGSTGYPIRRSLGLQCGIDARWDLSSRTPPQQAFDF